uniref:Mannose-1-phosphate guanyltransferase n=1 Tax=Ramularia collo-cygni TaxID=112498 RepID=A0A2D3V2H9_9PEZI
MPPKGKKGGGKDGKEAEREEPLQAVVFADSFETRFLPYTLEYPRCLLKLANTPLIEYTLEFLASAGVEEVYLYCGNHTDAVEEYLQQSKWTQKTSPFTLEVIRSSSRSVGDCMRDMMAKEYIVGDFICVYGDVVANISLETALAAHRARVAKDKKCIMTMVLREAGQLHRTKSSHTQSIFVIDEVKDRCVHYEQVRPGQTVALEIPPEALKEHIELDVRGDLIDCGIDICTPEVLAQYTDNFDWQLPRRGFLYGVLKDYETFQLTVHTHIVTEGYAARVKNLQAYDAISKDVISRWTYPLCPDMNLLADQSFQLRKRNVYREDHVKLARSSIVDRNAVIGKDTTIGELATITDSVIGRRCVIGNRVKIDGAYIWDDTHVGDDSIIETAIIADKVSIGKNCKIERGALISYGVKFADNIIVPGNRRISKLKRKRGYEADEVIQVPADPKIVGEGGSGYAMEPDEDEEDDAESLLCQVENINLEADDISSFDSESEEEDYTHDNQRESGRSDSFASIDSDEHSGARQQAADFHLDAVTSLHDDMAKGNEPENIQLEFNSLRMMNNADDKQLRRAVASAFGKRIASSTESGKSPKDAVGELIPRYRSLIEGYVKLESEQAEFMLYVQTDLAQRPQGEKLLLFLSNALAHNDIVEAEGFEAWWNDPRSTASEKLQAVRKETQPLIDVLCGDDDEESDEEESDED